MPRFQYVILSRSQPGREDDYEAWYRDQHLPDVCRRPGVIDAKLFRLDFQKVYDLEAPQWTLMTIYELEGDDPEAILASIVAVAGTEVMPLSNALDRSGMVQAVGHLVGSLP